MMLPGRVFSTFTRINRAKDQQGHTHSIPFFSIPSLAEKLSVMRPGEAFVDTNLVQLANEIAVIAEEQ